MPDDDEMPPLRGAPRDAIQAEFGRRLLKRMNEKGWDQSELARRASAFMPKDDNLGRDSVHHYAHGRSIPGPPRLLAIAKALGCKPEDLLPSRGMPEIGKVPPLEVRDMDEGRVWLRVNQATTWPIALKIMGLLKGEAE